MCRSEEYKLHPKYKTGVNYAYLGLEPHFLVFDEYVAFMAVMERDRRRADVISQMQQIAMLGRQMGYFILYVSVQIQNILPGRYGETSLICGSHWEEIRDGLSMVFVQSEEVFNKRIKGRGYRYRWEVDYRIYTSCKRALIF